MPLGPVTRSKSSSLLGRPLSYEPNVPRQYQKKPQAEPTSNSSEDHSGSSSRNHIDGQSAIVTGQSAIVTPPRYPPPPPTIQSDTDIPEEVQQQNQSAPTF